MGLFKYCKKIIDLGKVFTIFFLYLANGAADKIS